MRLGLVLIGILSLTACNSGSGGGSALQLTSEKTFCQPQTEPNVYVRADLSGPIAHFALLRITKPGEAAIEYSVGQGTDVPWKQVPDAYAVVRGANDMGMYANIVALGQIPAERLTDVNERTITSQKWVGTGISHPKSSAPAYASIVYSGASTRFVQSSSDWAGCSAFDDGLLKRSTATQSLNEFALYDWQFYASRTPEGAELEAAVEPKLPTVEVPLRPDEMYTKSWCEYKFNANGDSTGGLAVRVYTFLGNRMVASQFSAGETPSSTGFRYATRFTKNSVRTWSLDEKEDQYKHHPEYFRQRDATGRDFLNEGSPDQGANADSGFPMIVPCNDARVFSLHPDWQDWIAQIREIQLKALREPNDGDIGNIGFILPYVDENGVPQLKVIPKDGGGGK